jgi:serine/threonine protein kinase
VAAQFPNAGDVFLGRYRIERTIGAGGFARVYQALQVDLERPVALKILRPIEEGATAEAKANWARAFRARFEREAKLVSKLRSPNTVVMYDYGTTEDGLLYMVLEFIDGATLKEVMDAHGAFSAKRTVKILEQIFGSLHEAHALGVLHRDLKPQNIMVFEHVGIPDNIKVLDFGIAKAITGDAEEQSHEVTSAGMLVGTPRYMPPERIRGKPAGRNGDIYAVGLLAIEMLTGQRAIAESDPTAIIARHIDAVPFELPESLRVPFPLRQCIHKMVLKDPKERYQSARDVLADLELWNSEPSDELRVIGLDEVSEASAVAESVMERDWSMEMPAQPSVHPAMWPALAASILLVTATGFLVVFSLLPSGSDAQSGVPAPTMAPPAQVVPAATPNEAPPPAEDPPTPEVPAVEETDEGFEMATDVGLDEPAAEEADAGAPAEPAAEGEEPVAEEPAAEEAPPEEPVKKKRKKKKLKMFAL